MMLGTLGVDPEQQTLCQQRLQRPNIPSWLAFQHTCRTCGFLTESLVVKSGKMGFKVEHALGCRCLPCCTTAGFPAGLQGNP